MGGGGGGEENVFFSLMPSLTCVCVSLSDSDVGADVINSRESVCRWGEKNRFIILTIILFCFPSP